MSLVDTIVLQLILGLMVASVVKCYYNGLGKNSAPRPNYIPLRDIGIGISGIDG